MDERLSSLTEEDLAAFRASQGGAVNRVPLFSDEALALKFAERHADNLRFVALWSKWLMWDGARWKVDDTILAFDRVRALCREVAATYKAKRAAGIASAKTVAAVATLARADRRIAATARAMGPRPLAPQHPGRRRRPARRAHASRTAANDYMTKMTAVGPRGDCPKFKAFLTKIMGGDEALDRLPSAGLRLLPDRRHQRAGDLLQLRRRPERQDGADVDRRRASSATIA